MKVVADENGSVVVPTEAPGHRFEVEFALGGVIMLRPEQATNTVNRVKIVKENGYSVGVTERGFNEEELKKALKEFP